MITEGWFLSRSTMRMPRSRKAGPARVAAEMIVVGVALDVRLVDEIEAVPIAELVPALVVGVVGEAHRVEIVPLHDLDVADHVRQVEGLAHPLVVLVAIDALDEDSLAVDEEGAVPDLDAAEAEAAGGVLHRAPVGRDEADDEGVEGRILVAPRRRGLDGQGEPRLPARGAIGGADRGPGQRHGRACRWAEAA